MTDVAVLGAGHGGLAAAADLSRRGFRVRLQNRSAGPIRAVEEAGGIRTSGAIGDGLATIDVATTDLPAAVDGVEAIIVVLPAVAHADVARSLVDALAPDVPVVLNPGHMCGSLHLKRVFSRMGLIPPPIVELGTLSYICRSPEPGAVDVFLRAQGVPTAVSPPDRSDLIGLAEELFPGVRRVASPIEAWLYDVNIVLHPPGMVLGSAWLEATSGGYRFYADGITPSVEGVMNALDLERRAVGAAFGLQLPSLAETMAALGSADPAAAARGALGEAVRRGRANRSIRAPASVDHRYLHEDVPFGLVPMMALAAAGGVETPVAAALTVLAEVMTDCTYRRDGLTASFLGLEGLDAAGVERMLVGDG